MEKLLFIDSCIRGELSNTRKIALYEQQKCLLVYN
jgi:hypothetical protein